MKPIENNLKLILKKGKQIENGRLKPNYINKLIKSKWMSDSFLEKTKLYVVHLKHI